MVRRRKLPGTNEISTSGFINLLAETTLLIFLTRSLNLIDCRYELDSPQSDLSPRFCQLLFQPDGLRFHLRVRDAERAGGVLAARFFQQQPREFGSAQ